MEDNFSMDQGRGRWFWGRFKCMTLGVHFISIFITSAPPQTIRHWIPEVGDPCSGAPPDTTSPTKDLGHLSPAASH